jgi:DNA-binding GntR family transcriptional regulator
MTASMNIEAPEIAPSARDRFEKMHAAIRTRIVLLDYAPGTRLSEEALAAEFGVSRTPLRRVLVRLEGEGLLQSVHGVGTFVTDVEIGELTQTYQLRLELAELTGKLSAVTPDEALWHEFRALSARSKAMIDAPDPRRFAELNMDFFLALLRLTANEPLKDICERLYFQTTRIWLKSVFASRIDLADEVDIFDREVHDILRALEIGDLHAAALIQRAHISMSFERMRQNA